MGLWIKCPGCQAKNPLYVKVCSQCGLSLDNLPPEKRVYVLGEAASVTREPAKAITSPVAQAPTAPERATPKEAKAPAAPKAPVSEPKPLTKAEKKPKHPKKKKG